jgi:hypothetical protein
MADLNPRPPGRHLKLTRVRPRPVLAVRIAQLETELLALRQQQRETLKDQIALDVGPGVAFNARELWDHRLVSSALAAALRELNIRNARQLGKKLRQLGLTRVGVDEHGAVWTCG